MGCHPFFAILGDAHNVINPTAIPVDHQNTATTKIGLTFVGQTPVAAIS